MNSDFYYEQIEKILKQFNSRKREIERNGDLSNAGKNKKVTELETELKKSLSAIGEKFDNSITTEIQKTQERLSPKDSLSQLINTARQKVLKESATLETVTPGANTHNLLLLNAIEELKGELNRTLFIMQVSSLDPERLRALGKAYHEQGNIEKLEMLKESAVFKEDSALLEKQIQAYVDDIRQKSLSPIQKLAESELAGLERQKHLFNFSIETALTRNTFVDARKGQGETKVLPINSDIVDRHTEQLTKIARENPEEFMRLRRENKVEQNLDNLDGDLKDSA